MRDLKNLCATLVNGYAYAYTDGMNLTGITNQLTAANSNTLSYTAANRLAAASGACTFTYDAAGNTATDARLGMTAPLAYTYNNRNRHSALSGGSPARTATYIHNPLEQMISRVTNASGAPTTTIHYIYDLDGHLIIEANGSSTGATVTSLREYIWLPTNDNAANDTMAEQMGAGANDNTAPDLPLATIDVAATPTISMVHTDHLGRPVRMTSAAKATTWSAIWTPWGTAHSVTGTTAIINNQNLRFPGQFFLIETGLAYNWHRTYDPATGRYTQPDPLRFVDGPSVYAYAGNSPFMNTDPDGRMIPAIVVGMLVGGAFDLGMQLLLNDFDFNCVNWWQVGASAALGAAGGGGTASNFLKNSKSGLNYFKSSHKYDATLKRVRAANNVTGRDTQLHHWLIPNGRWGESIANFIKNHPSNLNPVPRATNLGISNGTVPWSAGVPQWAKNWGAAWAGGLLGNATGNVAFDD